MLVRSLLLFLLFLFFARAVWRLVEGIARGASAPGAGRSRGPSGPAPVKMAQCPVCGTYVVPGKSISLVRGGRTVYFCSESCREKLAS